ncbi:hypothetical protein [Nonomuraea sp. NPDC003201]
MGDADVGESVGDDLRVLCGVPGEGALVRGAPHRGHLPGRDVEVGAGLLGKRGDQLGGAAWGETPQVLAIDALLLSPEPQLFDENTAFPTDLTTVA